MPQDSQCPIGPAYREIIQEAKSFGIDPWMLAIIGLGIVVLLTWLIVRPAKRLAQTEASKPSQ